MTPEKLATELGTSRSSYYWHFGNQEEFRSQVIDYCVTTYTRIVADTLESFDGTPRERLSVLLKLVHEMDITKYEGAVYALAYGNDALVRRIEQTYRIRRDFLQTTLKEKGVGKDRVAPLSRLMICYLTWETKMGFSASCERAIKRDEFIFSLLAGT